MTANQICCITCHAASAWVDIFPEMGMLLHFAHLQTCVFPQNLGLQAIYMDQLSETKNKHRLSIPDAMNITKHYFHDAEKHEKNSLYWQAGQPMHTLTTFCILAYSCKTLGKTSLR